MAPTPRKKERRPIFFVSLFFLSLTLLNTNIVFSQSILEEPSFSQKRGIYENKFDLTITAGISNAEILYTFDGSDPSKVENPLKGNAPLKITIDPDNQNNRPNTPCIVVRACILANGLTSTSVTHTYIFPEKVKEQSANSPGNGWPDDEVNNQEINYEMDSEVVNDPLYKDSIIPALLSIPSISLVTDLKHLFDDDSGIYVNARQDGREWERPGSIELIYPDDQEGFQVNAGIRIRGGASRSGNNPKHAFRLFFRGEYGPKKLHYPLFGNEGADEFDKLDLRTAQNYSWSFKGSSGDDNGSKNTFLRDIFSRDLQSEMGHPYTRSKYCHLYVNGVYWGLFQTEERPEAAFGETYLNGKDEDYDVVVANRSDNNSWPTTSVTDGNLDAWKKLWDITLEGYSNESNYNIVQGINIDCPGNPKLLDIDNLIDYMMGALYTGDFDAPISNFAGNNRPNNFFALYNRNDPDGFKFMRHDAEHSLFKLNEDRTGPFPAGEGDFSLSNPQYIHQKLVEHPDYRMKFADRVYRHFYNKGPLTVQASLNRILKRKKQIETAIIAESARWGDSKVSEPRTKQKDWIPAVNYLLKDYIPFRAPVVLDQFKEKGWYPDFQPPVITAFSDTIDTIQITTGAGITFQLKDTNDTKGTIYYTLDGSDPRLNGGKINPDADSGQSEIFISINRTTVINARIHLNDSWSALHQLYVYVEQDLSPLKITEIMYHPPDLADTSGRELEFIEFKNTSKQDTLFLTGVKITDGISYAFPDSSFIPPNGFKVIASNSCALQEKCPDIKISGKYFGRLSNSGEKITVSDHTGSVFLSMEYSDKWPWPSAADGLGFSLVPKETDPVGTQNSPELWQMSDNNSCGSPGEDDPKSIRTGIDEHLNFEVTVYPNPTQTETYLLASWHEFVPIKVIVTDMRGVYVHEGDYLTNQKIKIGQAFTPGVYLIQITHQDHTLNSRFVKISSF